MQMNSKELKQAIKDDIETMKHLELDIMPAGEYYKNNFRLFFQVFFMMYSVTVVSSLFWFSIKRINLLIEHSIIDGLLVSLGISFLVSGFIMLLIYADLNRYLILKYQLSEMLKTGPYLVKVLEKSAFIAIGVFACLVFVALALFNPLYGAPVAEFVGFMITMFAVGFLMDLEINRVGISILFDVIKQYYDKKEKGFA